MPAGRRVRGIAAAAALGTAVALACSEIGPEGVPASIAFDALPWPAVVLDDSLRDANGVAVPLAAAVFDSRNEPIPDAPVRFLSLDATAEISEEGFVTGQSFGSARIVAEIAGLQTSPLTLRVTRRPDSLHAIGDTVIIVEYDVTTPEVKSAALPVLLRHLTPPTEADTVVPGWIVHFAIVGQTPGDTTHGYLVREGSTVKSGVDTTDAAGRAAMTYRLNTVTFPVAQDTLEVLATASHLGASVPGSPVRFILLIRPAPAS